MTRGAGLLLTAFALYVVAPSLLALLDAVPSLGDVGPAWFLVVAGAEVASFVSLWALLRIALRTKALVHRRGVPARGERRQPGGAGRSGRRQRGAGRRAGAVRLPGRGGRCGAVVDRAADDRDALRAARARDPRDARRARGARPAGVGLLVSLVLAAVLVGVGAAVLWSDRVARQAGRRGGLGGDHVRAGPAEPRRWPAGWSPSGTGSGRPSPGTGCRRCRRPPGTGCSTWLRWSRRCSRSGRAANPFLVLLAYVVSLALALVPITPGGLGFVEAGLTSLLVLAGASAQEAVVATLLYRLASFWLPIPLGLLAWGGWRARRRTAGVMAP